jgi:alpha,alpha-trehalose phosphorylase
MIEHHCFACEPWTLREIELDLDVLAQSESLFALSNGHIGLRGNLDEGEPAALPGTYLNAFYEVRPLPNAEIAYGQPEDGQAIVNVTNGKVMRLLVDDEPFDVRYGKLRRHERVLDFRTGLLTRTVDWVSPAGQAIALRSTRLVSLTQRSIAALLYEVEPLDEPARLVVQSELIANEPMPAVEGDPRVPAAVARPLEAEFARSHEARLVLNHATRQSGLRMAAGIDHVIEGPDNAEFYTEAQGDLARLTVAADVAVGERLRIVKFLAYGWSSQRTTASLRDQVVGALAQARHTGWDGLVSEQHEYLERFWTSADVEVEGDAELQHAVRFGVFHTLQAGARAEQRAIGAKGLTGSGYDGHTFWDTESFVLIPLTFTAPDAAADALRWRHATLDLARERARQLGLRGAAFPWRTIRGQECSGYWPAGTAAFHVSGDIALAVIRYRDASGDEIFMREVGAELLMETARLWRSLGHHDAQGRFRIDGVTGPDEYSALADNNVYTNLIAQRNMRAAAEEAERHPKVAAELAVNPEETAEWRDAAAAMTIPYDEALGVHQQAEGFTDHERWDFESYSADRYPLMLHAHYFDLYRKQVVKQADLVLTLHLFADSFSAEQKARAFDYYEPLTVRDSSLSACTQAVVAAEVGHLDLAYDYFAEAALMDLEDRQHNTRNGLHIASLAGAWLAAVAGFGGMRDHGGALTFAPRLPGALPRLAFRLIYRGRCLAVEVGQEAASYRLLRGDPLDIAHHGEPITVTSDAAVTRRIPPAPRRSAPSQPPGRAPKRRVGQDDGT